MAELGAAADTNTPALANLNASAGQLTTFLQNLKPLSETTQVNLRSLAAAARKGRPAVGRARPLVNELDKATTKAPELANNAAIVTEHLNDRKNAVEKDPRSPGGQGYTGLRGDPAVGLRPVAGDQRLRQERLHAQGRSLPLEVQRLREPAVAQGEDGQGPVLLQGLRRDPRAQPAGITTPTRPRRAASSPAPTKSRRRRSPSEAAPSAQGRDVPTGQGHGRRLTRSSTGRAAQARDRALRKAIAGRQRRRKLRKRLEDQLGIKLPTRTSCRPAPARPRRRPAASRAAAPRAPSVPSTGATGQLLDYLLAP
jgi:hypothetical protein